MIQQSQAVASVLKAAPRKWAVSVVAAVAAVMLYFALQNGGGRS